MGRAQPPVAGGHRPRAKRAPPEARRVSDRRRIPTTRRPTSRSSRMSTRSTPASRSSTPGRTATAALSPCRSSTCTATSGPDARPGIPFLEGSTYAQAFLSTLYTSTLRDIRRTYQRRSRPSSSPGGSVCPRGRSLRITSPNWAICWRTPRTSRAMHTIGPAARSCLTLPTSTSISCLWRTTTTPPLRCMMTGRNRLSSGLRRCSIGGSGFLTTTVPAKKCTTGANSICGSFSTKPWMSSRPIPPHFCGTWVRTPGIGISICAITRIKTPIYSVTSADLEDDRWVVRAWHADQWIRGLSHRFHRKTSPRQGPTSGPRRIPAHRCPEKQKPGMQISRRFSGMAASKTANLAAMQT